MNKLFWAPQADASQPATFVIDGLCSTAAGTDEQNQAMVKFGEARQWPCEKAITEQQGKDGKFAKSLQIAIRKEGISIRSNLLAAAGGRALPYMFFTTCTDLSTAIADLKQYAKQCQAELNTEELELAATEIANYQAKGRDKERERLTTLGGGWEKMWYHVRRH